jgi:GNAT superfamily N-acetyltransferase
MASTDAREPAPAVIAHPLGTAYLDGLLALSGAAGWNQQADDWRFMLAAGAGWGLSTPDGTVVASVVALPWAPAAGGFGWVSMVMVLPDHRRHGHASRLLDVAIGWLRARGLTPLLDATPAGHAVYRRQGFRDTWTFERWQRDAGAAAAPAARPPQAGIEVRALAPADWPAVLALDAPAFGTDRGALLRSLAARLPACAHVALRGAHIEGVVLGRPGRDAVQVGPLVADDDDVAVALLDAALAAAPDRVFVDAPAMHAGFGAALAARGFRTQRPFTRMVYGEGDAPRAPGDPSRLRLVAGPELG